MEIPMTDTDSNILLASDDSGVRDAEKQRLLGPVVEAYRHGSSVQEISDAFGVMPGYVTALLQKWSCAPIEGRIERVRRLAECRRRFIHIRSIWDCANGAWKMAQELEDIEAAVSKDAA